MSRIIEIMDYLRIPRTDVPRAVALGRSLVTAVPDIAPAAVTERARWLDVATVSLRKQYDLRELDEPVGLPRFDSDLKHSWGALYGALQATARIPFASPEGELAQSLLNQLFSDGLSFVNQSYEKRWFESQRRLRRIEEDKLADSVVQASGNARFLEAVRVAHNAYANALNITEPDSAEEESTLAEGISAVRDAVSLYVAQVIAWAQQDDGRYLEEGYRALRPIDAARDAAARAIASGTELGNDEETTESETATASSDPGADSDAPPTSSETPTASSGPGADSDAPPTSTQTPEVLDPEEAPVSAVG